MPELRRLWWRAQPNACTAWRKVNGPLAAAAMSLRRIGWSWPEPFTFIDDLGTKLNVTMCSPAYIGMVLQEGCLRTLERKAMQKHQDTIPLDEHFEHHEHQGRRVCCDAVLSCINSSKIDYLGKVHIRCLATGGLWTRQRFKQAGYEHSGMCPLCQEQPDTVHHRLWECNHP